jgi:hypothetical protein
VFNSQVTGTKPLQVQLILPQAWGSSCWGVLGAVAEFEADIRKERQLEGIAKAKAAGVYKGRKPSVDVEAVKAL